MILCFAQDPIMQSMSGSKTKSRFSGLYSNLFKLSYPETSVGRNTFKAFLFFTSKVNRNMRVNKQEEMFTSINKAQTLQ